ncbi:protein translocase subunit SecF [Spirilliplanes yamanashiensis]|uniref:Protein-export membrane protein SecF n=1 Tax=Spirilliplanes yamanashiensis TaxID=42233 RepID=A0A8J3YCA2_9ACTN|nr:protein translocase subunit SecF [Spirilliplanes yamanashiensis]MDP9818668.1 preprotein translocase subunit SecF [Spirilliplanes yamanashiensis]GIJ05125.1 protein-export membrane protein SecF [Spirilliplanes yamanashiensis]
MADSSLANRLYRGEAGLNVVGRRKMWFTIAAIAVLISIGSFAINRFHLGIEFAGGTKLSVPASVGTIDEARAAVDRAVDALPADAEGVEPEVVTIQRVDSVDAGGGATYTARTSELTNEQALQVKQAVARDFGLAPDQISDSGVSAAWGESVTRQALIGLLVFIALVMVYLILRFEWRMAVAAVSSLLLDLVLTAGVYSLVGFEVTPSTVIGFLTILGFSLYDVVVVFDKVQENTRGITAGSSRTYSEAANLAVNQTIMRSINTGLVALLPVGGLLFIGAGLLGAGTLKDLGLVLFVGMGLGVFSSIVFATPVLAALKEREPRIKAHTQRVLARRASAARGEVPVKAGAAERTEDQVAAMAGAAPKVGSRPNAKRTSGSSTNRGGRSGGAGNRPSGKRR